MREASFSTKAPSPWVLPSSSTQSCTLIPDHPLPPDVSMALAQKAITTLLRSSEATPVDIEARRRAARLLLQLSLSSKEEGDSALPLSLSNAIRLIRAVLEGTGKLLDCSSSRDDSLMSDAIAAHSYNGSLSTGRRILIAANLFNSADVLPNMILQIVSLALSLPLGAISVSIYESGSQDSTRLWLHFLKVVLCLLEVPYQIVTGGELVRPRDDATEKDTDRIVYLASIRNKAMEPLLTLPHLLNWPQSQSHNHDSIQAPSLDSKLVFLNDVLFCHMSLIRLVMLDQHLACGIDLSNESPLGPNDGRLLWFYDSWVSRDRLGNMITSSSFPNMKDPESSTRAKSGLPFPAQCCWNGMASISLIPLIIKRLRLRSSFEGECRASECSLFCDDLHRLGHHSIAIDPSVRVVYRMSHAHLAFNVQESFDPGLEIRPCSWNQFKASGPIHTPERAIDTSQSLCCNKNVKNDRIVWKNCSYVDLMAVNYTKNLLGSLTG